MAYGAVANARLSRTIGTPVPDSQPVVLSAWFLGAAGATAVQPAINASIDPDQAISTSLWTRLVKKGTSTAGGSDVVFFENRASGTAQTVYAYGAQLIVGRYALAPVKRASVDYDPDSMVYLSAQVPRALREQRWAMSMTFQWAPSDLVAGEERILMCFRDRNHLLRARHNGTDVRIESTYNNAIQTVSPPVTGSVPEVTRLVGVDTVTGALSIDGVWGPVLSPWVWPAGPMRVGGVVGVGAAGDSEADAFFQPPVVL
jgi:hypothetical protein